MYPTNNENNENISMGRVLFVLVVVDVRVLARIDLDHVARVALRVVIHTPAPPCNAKPPKQKR